MKITIAGKTPMERLTNFTKKIVAVPKEEIANAERVWQKSRAKKRRPKP